MKPDAPQKNPGQAPGVDPQALKDLWSYNLTNHKPTPEAIRKIEALRSAAIAMSHVIIDITPPGRDQALALTSCEQMLFHANAAVARNENEDIAGTPEEDKNLDNNAGIPAPATEGN